MSRVLVGSLYIKINIPTYSRRSRRLPRRVDTFGGYTDEGVDSNGDGEV